ncbi:hypothetical protein [Georgenia wangjunii]|uniref:hypothetical protein n=1 Tax=Georgenia wangjunii TaxID=3117730 RepID=UPI002F26213C
MLMQATREQLNQGQRELDLGLDAPAGSGPGRARVIAASSQLWEVRADAYRM